MSTTAEKYPGELEMFRGLVRTLRTVVRENNTFDEVRRLLWEHATDEAAAHAEAREKSSPDGADATPEETSIREARLAQLLDTIRTHRGAWTPSRVQELRRFTGGPTQRNTARRHLAELHRRGHLNQHGPEDGRFYTLKLRKDSRS
ncbi:hypothetical protein [Streptomyces sp. NPDC056948]|uniref:hypothetical protein n=1 Tax=Streptomyces sp. NPDC056948 TaxID=3345975 RepID=UPI00362DB4B1